jgi:hypothetical protein
VQATLETAFGYTGIVGTRCTDIAISGICLVDFDDAPTEVITVTLNYASGNTSIGPLRHK